MILRSVKRILPAQKVNMEGLIVLQPFPTKNIEQIDPFLLLHHVRTRIPAERNASTLGIGPHPHRGFSPVTFIYEGGVHHRDSRGNNSVVYAGGTQWMHAGMGIVHSERPPQKLADHGGYMEILQLWINVPKVNKMEQPHYHPLSKEDTPEWKSSDGKILIEVVTGQYESVKGPVKTFTPINAFRVEMKEKAAYDFIIPENHNLFLYLIKGELRIKKYGLTDEKNAVLFENDGEGIQVTASSNSKFIIMSGVPINEPIAQQGPFVMNTDTEILVAMRDYQMGKMGVLIED